MKLFALAALALAIIAAAMPASAQSDGVPVKNALVVLTGQDDRALQPVLAAGGSPVGIRKALDAAKELIAISAHHASTDAGGRFLLEAPLKAGTHNVTVFAPGFVTSSASVAVDGGSTNVTIFLQPSAVVSGRVTDERGSPISGVVVAAGSRHSANYDVTMDDGVFVLDTGLKTGPHDIYAFKPGIDPGKLQNNSGFGSLLLENKVPALFKAQDGGYLSHTSKMQLEQGKLTTLNVQLKDSQTISGRVTDSGGNSLSGVAVFAFDSRGDMANTAAITDADGRYALDNDLAPGNYTVVVPSLFNNNNEGYAPASATAEAPAENVDFVLQKSKTISGSVVDSTGNAVEGATVFAVSKDFLGSPQLGSFLAAGAAEARTDSEGRFALDSGIGSGTYAVTASFGDVPASSSIEARAGMPVRIALDFRETVVIKGRVADSAGAPIKGATVIPSFASAIPGAELFAARTDSAGAFVLTAPLKDNSTRPLFGTIIVSADGYRAETVAVRDYNAVVMEKIPPSKITGTVVAQKSLSPPVEVALTRNGTIMFEHEGTQYGVKMQTNSRVLEASFEPASKRIQIKLEGVQGSAGMSEFAIPKDFMAGPFAVSLDGRLAEPESVRVSENQTHAVVALEHDHGLQEIMIQGTTAVPEFPLPLALAAAGFAAAMLFRRLARI